MNVTIALPGGLALLALAGTLIRTVETFRRAPLEAIETAVVVEVALMAGVVLHAMLPGGYVIGAVAGATFVVVRLARLRRRPADMLARRAGRAAGPGEALLVLHDRADDLRGEIAEVVGWPGVAFDLLVLVAATSLVVLGLGAGSVVMLLVGTLCLFPPLSQGIRLAVHKAEAHRVHRLVESRLEGSESATEADAVDD